MVSASTKGPGQALSVREGRASPVRPHGFAPKKYRTLEHAGHQALGAQQKNAQWRIKEDTNRAWGNDCRSSRSRASPARTRRRASSRSSRTAALCATRAPTARSAVHHQGVLTGAAAAVAAQQHYDAKQLRCDIGTKGKNEDKTETNTYPMLGTIAPGALMLYDQAVVAFNQEAFSNAKEIKDALDIHKKVTRGAAQAGLDILTRKLSASTGVVPPQIVGKLDPEVERKERSTRKKQKPAADKADP